MSHAAQCLLCQHSRQHGMMATGCLRFESSSLDSDTSSILAAMLFQNAETKPCPGFVKLDFGPDAYRAIDLPTPEERTAMKRNVISRNLHRSDYSVVDSFTNEDRERVVKLVDLDLGGKSVTNDAENVVAEILRDYPVANDFLERSRTRYGYNRVRIYYRDSMGNVDELQNDGEKFTGFAPARHITIRG